MTADEIELTLERQPMEEDKTTGGIMDFPEDEAVVHLSASKRDQNDGEMILYWSQQISRTEQDNIIIKMTELAFLFHSSYRSIYIMRCLHCCLTIMTFHYIVVLYVVCNVCVCSYLHVSLVWTVYMLYCYYTKYRVASAIYERQCFNQIEF